MTKPNLIAVPAKPDRIGIADRLDDLARKAALLSAAIHGLQARQFDSKDMFSGAEELAWELRQRASGTIGHRACLRRGEAERAVRMTAFVYRARLWLTQVLLDLAEAVAPVEVRADRERLRRIS